MSSIIKTTCPKCGRDADFHVDDGLTYCQKELRQVLPPYEGAMWQTSGGGCGAVTSKPGGYTPPDRRGGI